MHNTRHIKLAMGPNGAQDITPLSDDEQERDGESLTRRKYFCMRLASGCLRPAETGAKMRATGGLDRQSGLRRAEETKPDRYTPQKPGVTGKETSGFAVSAPTAQLRLRLQESRSLGHCPMAPEIPGHGTTSLSKKILYSGGKKKPGATTAKKHCHSPAPTL
jgi:hypothetical protein